MQLITISQNRKIGQELAKHFEASGAAIKTNVAKSSFSEIQSVWMET